MRVRLAAPRLRLLTLIVLVWGLFQRLLPSITLLVRRGVLVRRGFFTIIVRLLRIPTWRIRILYTRVFCMFMGIRLRIMAAGLILVVLCRRFGILRRILRMLASFI